MLPSVELITDLCLQQYELLPKQGKPTDTEYTILTGIVQHNINKKNITTKVVSLGAGTKCLGQHKLHDKGLIIHDSHGEILARRGFLRYIYAELVQATICCNDTNIFTYMPETANFHLKAGITFHFFNTQTPCGDACVEEMEESKLVEQPTINLAHLIYTGAKQLNILPGDDLLLQDVGALRYKPGRGVRTLSMSCSDKLAKWNILGIQGALLHVLLEKPIYLTTINILERNCKLKNLRRAIYDRFSSKVLEINGFSVQKPELRIIQPTPARYFRAALIRNKKQVPSPNGLIWISMHKNYKGIVYEICVNGWRQGVTRKLQNSPQAALHISKYHLLKCFCELLDMNELLKRRLKLKDKTLSKLSYKYYKLLAKEYQIAWQLAKKDFFGSWCEKPTNLQEFSY